MTETARFFDSVLYGEADQAKVQSRFRDTGVLKEVANALVVLAPGSMFVQVAAGEAMVQGFHYENTAPLSLAIAANSSGSTRIDVVALRLNRTANTLAAVIIQGTPGSGAPTLTQVDGGNWELPLAQISIATGTLAITSGMITDQRVYSKRLTSGDEMVLGTAIPASSQIQRRTLTVDPVTKLLYFAEPVAPQRNFLHNSSFRVNQRAIGVVTSTASPICDRWNFNYLPGTGTYAWYGVAQDIGNVGVPGMPINPTTIIEMVKTDTNAPTATSFVGIYHYLEGTDVRSFISTGMVLSFFAAASKAGTYGFTINQVGGTLRYNGTFTIAAPNVQQFFWVYIPWNGSSGTWVINNTAGMLVQFIASAGASFQATVANAWNTENKPAALGITNSLTAVNDNLYILAPKLEYGPLPTRWDMPSLQEEQLQCYRYLYVDNSPHVGMVYFPSQVIFNIKPPVPMRTNPSYSSAGINAIGTAIPTANQISVLMNSGIYMAGLTYSNLAMGLGAVQEISVVLNSSTNSTNSTQGQAVIVVTGTGGQHILNADI